MKEFIVGRSYWHRTRQQFGYYSEDCAAIQKTNPDKNSSIFLEFYDMVWGVTETLEVTINLLDNEIIA